MKETKIYRNVFEEAGYDKAAIDKKIEDSFQAIFYGPDRFFHEAGSDMGYMEDTGNHDARTEGMSYGMMMCVQMDRKEEFDRIWMWTMTHMYMDRGFHKGYFAWSCSPEGKPNAYGPAPDGEEFFAMALLFASHRWGDGEGIFNYSAMARQILHTVIHQEDDGIGRNMWDLENCLIRFIPERDYTDPSYHLPHFYELFALWADQEDRGFWKKAADESRAYLQKACHPVTGLSPEYSYFDGRPYEKEQEIFGKHDWYYSDAYRTIANIALDYEWFGIDGGFGWESRTAANLQRFFCETVKDQPDAVYSIDGQILAPKALHPVAIIAVNAQASLALDALEGNALECVRKFWETPLRSGERRYYDNCLYFFALLALGGRYRIW